MRISDIQLKEEGEFILLTALCKIRHIGYDRVYFKFEKKYKDFITCDASPFAAALLIPSMKMGQDLVIEGSISAKLAEGMREIIEFVVPWNIGLEPISVKATETKPDEGTAALRNASFFSGGVDSFYTYLKHKEEGQEKIDCFILANGFDISLKNPKLWDLTCETVGNVAEKEKIEVIKVESNIRDLIEPAEIWDYTHGGCLAALGLALRQGIGKVFVPSSLAYGQLLPWGSRPEMDPLWSTENISFIHDGAETQRVYKANYIAQSPLVLQNLRVCYLNERGKFNCGVCDKCLRTMINLRIAEKLEQSETFPHQIDLELVRKLKVSGKQNATLHNENLQELEKFGMDKDLQEAIRGILDKFYHPKFDPKEKAKKLRFYIREGINKIRLIDFFYNKDRLYNLKNSLLEMKTRGIKKAGK